MPRLKVPLIHPTHPKSVTLSYRTHGHGPHAVILLPGLLVPSSMYDLIAAILSSNPSFTIITLDNRGIGRSSTPPALSFNSGYTATNLALDAWAVVDAVVQSRHLSRLIGVVGHSMGGMIAQHMVRIRPRNVRFLGLISTHAGGLRNLLPSIGMLVAGCRVLYSGFDQGVQADVNLRLHFTDKFLEEVVGGALHISSSDGEPNAEASNREPVDGLVEPNEEPDNDDEANGYTTPPPSPREPSYSSPNLSTPCDSPIASPETGLVRTSSGTDLRFLHSKLHHFSRDARLHFNLSPRHLTTALRQQHQLLIRRLRSVARTTRREVYHAQYTAPNNVNGSVLDSAIGHARVVWSHTLPWDFLRLLRGCNKVVKLVVLGRHDQVVTPVASRRLASLIDATTVVEVDAAHFVTEEVTAEVTTQILFGLRTAFFGGRRCDCEWCGEEKEYGDCRLC